MQAQRRPDHVGVVARGGGRVGAAVAKGVLQPAVSEHARGDKVERTLGELEPGGCIEDDRGARERGDHQPVPVGEHLVVPARAHALGARRKELLAKAGKPPLVLRAAELQAGETIEDRVAFPVAFRGGVVDEREGRAVLEPEHGDDLIEAPDVELAFLALGVGVERGGEGAAIRDHLALEPGDRLGNARFEQGRAASRDRPRSGAR